MTEHVAPAASIFQRWHLRDPDAMARATVQHVTTRTGRDITIPHPDSDQGATICGLRLNTADLWTTGTPTDGDPICPACATGQHHPDDTPLF